MVFTQIFNTLFLCLLTLSLFFGLFKVGKKETFFWTGKINDAGLNKKRFLCCFILIFLCLIYGFQNFDSKIFFWEESFSIFLDKFFIHAFWLACLAALALIDLSFRLLPYCLNFSLALVGLLTTKSFYLAFFIDTIFLLIVLILVCISRVHSINHDRKIGLGDMLLLLALSFWFDTFNLSLIVFLSSTTMILLFVLYRRKFNWNKKTKFPFGPALSFFSILVGLFNNHLI